MTRVIAFDVNETLLDLAALDAPFAGLLGSAELRGPWFAQMLQLSFVGGLTDRYVDFGTAQRAALRMVAERVGQAVSAEAVDELVQRMSSLPPHPEVPDALAAGAKAAFVARPGMVKSPLGAQPDIVAADIADAVDQIMRHDVEEVTR